MKNIIDFIKEEMAARGMTYDHLALCCGMSKANIWDKLNKRVNPNFGNVKKILEGLGYKLVIERLEESIDPVDEGMRERCFFETAEEEQVSYECVESLLASVGYEIKITQNNEKNVKKGIDN